MKKALLIVAIAAMSLGSISSVDAMCDSGHCRESSRWWFECEMCCLDVYEGCKDAGGEWCGTMWAECSQECDDLPKPK